jgi:hypothetical protein
LLSVLSGLHLHRCGAAVASVCTVSCFMLRQQHFCSLCLRGCTCSGAGRPLQRCRSWGAGLCMPAHGAAALPRAGRRRILPTTPRRAVSSLHWIVCHCHVALHVSHRAELISAVLVPWRFVVDETSRYTMWSCVWCLCCGVFCEVARTCPR